MWRTIFFFGVLGSMLNIAVCADQIVLKNGDRLTGTIVELDDEDLTMKSELAGEITVGWSDVEGISSTQPVYVTLKDARMLLGTLAASNGQVGVQTQGAGTVMITRDLIRSIRSEERQEEYQIEFDRMRHPRLLDGWSGFAETGLTMTRGNSVTSTLEAGMSATRMTRRDKFGLYFTSIYGNEGTTTGQSLTTARSLRGGARYDHDIFDGIFGFGVTDFESDKFQQLNLRNVTGGGLGWHALRGESTSLDLLAGVGYDQEYFSTPVGRISERVSRMIEPSNRRAGRFRDRTMRFNNPTDLFTRKTAELYFGQELAHDLTRGIYLTQKLGFFPNLSESREYRIAFDSTIATKITSWLEWQVSLSDRYLSNPVPGVKKNDLLLTTGIRIAFGRGDAPVYRGTFLSDGDTNTPQDDATATTTNKKKDSSQPAAPKQSAPKPMLKKGAKK
jgi:small nuclear ribonucleoprotein (snRNP)-like protein